MAFDPTKPLKKAKGQIAPQYWDDNIEDWEVLQGSAGAYRTQVTRLVAKDPFSGSSTMTKVFGQVMSGLTISNDGNADLTFTINDGEGAGNTYKVYAGAVWEDELPTYSSVTIVTTVAFQAYGRYAFGSLIVSPPPVDTTAPDNVTNLVTSNLTATGVTLTWAASASNDCAGYDIYRGVTLLGSVTGRTTTTYNATGLTQATQYTFIVKSKDAANNISSGTQTTVTTPSSADTTPPANATNLATANITQTGVTLNWIASVSSDVASYDVFNGSTFLANVTNGTTYNVNGLTASTAYTFVVKAKDSSGNAASGTSVNATTLAPVDSTAPTVTVNPVAGTYTSTQSVTLLANETATIYYTLDGSTPTVSSSVYSTALTISSTTTLKYFARDTAGNSSTVQTQVYAINQADTTAPNPVTGLTVGTPTANSVPLSWTLSSSGDVTAQEAAYSTDGTNFTVFSGSINPSSTSTTVTGLTANTAYTFRIVAIDGASNRSSAVITTATTTANTIEGLTSVTTGMIHSYDFSQGSGSQTTLSDLTGELDLTLTGFTFSGDGWTGNGLKSNNVGIAKATDMTKFGMLDNNSCTFVIHASTNLNGASKASTYDFVSTGPNEGGLHLTTTSYGGRSAVGGRFQIGSISNGVLNRHPSNKYLTAASEVSIVRDDWASVSDSLVENTPFVIAFTVDSGTLTASFYLNGTLHKSMTVADAPKYHGLILNKAFKTVHSLLLYNRPLSQSEITTVSNELLA